MYEIFIKNYIDNLTVDNVINLAKEKNINLSLNDATILLDLAKREWKSFYKGDPSDHIKCLEEKIDKENFNKLKQIYIEAKQKWQN